MAYTAGAAYTTLFITTDLPTGAAVNADSLPVATATRNGTDDGTFLLTVTPLDTGRYAITGTIPAGYVPGDVLHVSMAATIAGVATKAIVDTQMLGPDPALLDGADALEVGLTLRQALRLIAAACAGKASGLATATATYRSAVADDVDRLVATTDAAGNRTAITYTLD